MPIVFVKIVAIMEAMKDGIADQVEGIAVATVVGMVDQMVQAIMIMEDGIVDQTEEIAVATVGGMVDQMAQAIMIMGDGTVDQITEIVDGMAAQIMETT